MFYLSRSLLFMFSARPANEQFWIHWRFNNLCGKGRKEKSPIEEDSSGFFRVSQPKFANRFMFREIFPETDNLKTLERVRHWRWSFLLHIFVLVGKRNKVSYLPSTRRWVDVHWVENNCCSCADFPRLFNNVTNEGDRESSLRLFRISLKLPLRAYLALATKIRA